MSGTKLKIHFQIVLQNIYLHVLIYAAVFALVKMLGQSEALGLTLTTDLWPLNLQLSF